MIVYQTNAQGVFLWPVEADPSPLEPERFLIPAGCVTVAPPAIPPEMMAVWNGAIWSLLPLPSEQDAPTADTAPPTADQILAQLTKAIDMHVEAAAITRQYNSAAHMASYVASTVPQWAAEAQAFVAWRDAVWLFALDRLAAIQRGEEAVPSSSDLVASLPQPPF